MIKDQKTVYEDLDKKSLEDVIVQIFGRFYMSKLAKMIGVHNATIWRLFRDDKPIKRFYLLAIARAIEIQKNSVASI